MKGPAATGAFIYANDIEILSNFYIKTCEMKLVHQMDEMKILAANGSQLIIHVAPFEIKMPIPLEERWSPIKLFFTVKDIQSSESMVKEFGGIIKPEVWEGPRFSVKNIIDPEGNLFHLRWYKS